MLRTLRSLAFYLGYVPFTVAWATISLTVAWAMPLRQRRDFIIGRWTRAVLWWLKITCGIRVHASGLERIPDAPCIVFVQHQSTWETLWVQTLVGLQTTLVKRELLRIPFWGWAFALTQPISIDRSQRASALRQLIEQGEERLRRGITVTLFPEGTRIAPGGVGRFQLGGAALAAATGAPVVVVAHNAGLRWPAHRFHKQPGTIAVEVSEPFLTEGKSAKEINRLCERWLRDAQHRLAA